MGWAVGQHERHAFSLHDAELCDRREILALQGEGRVKNDPARPGGGSQTGLVFELRHPGDRRPIIEAQRQVQSHRDVAAPSLDQTDDRRIRLADRHEIDQCHTAVRRLEHRFQHHCAIAVGAPDAGGRINGTDPPSPVFGCSQQSREASRAVEPRPA